MAARRAEPMTPRRRVEIALGGGCADRVPFTVYECMIPQCQAERQMRNRGLCIVQRRGVFRTHRPNVKVTEQVTWQDDRRVVRTTYETPAGTVWTLGEPVEFTTWMRRKMFQRPEDYRTILFLLTDERYEPDYESFAAGQRDFGEDAVFRTSIGLEPLQALITGGIMDMETFCLEWMDRRDEVLRLYRALVENRRRVYPIVADSPASHANYGGNVVPQVIGPENFRTYYLPHYQEAAEALHRRGKLIGCHLDDDCRLLAGAIAEAPLDYIEAFTPAPGSDMTLADARAVWPGKVLWLNFPSSLHLEPDERVRRATVDLLEQAGSPAGLIMGITEDMPPRRWRDSCRAIMDGLDEHAREHPERYP